MFNNLIEILNTNQELIITGLVSITFVFLIWSVKESYQKHCNEVALLGKIEIIFAHNLGSLLTNQSFFEEWLKALKTPRLYNCAYRTYILLEHDDFKITNQKLLNDLVRFNFSIKGLAEDLDLFFSGYHQSSLMLLPKELMTEWHNLNTNTLDQSDTFVISFEQAIDDAKNLIAFSRAYTEQKRKTPYGLVRSFLGKNLLPNITDDSIQKQREEIEKDLEEKQAKSKGTA